MKVRTIDAKRTQLQLIIVITHLIGETNAAFDECLVKVHTNTNDKLIKIVGEHCHLQESETVDIRAFREKVKQRVVNETTPIPRIYDEECAKTTLSAAAIAVLPSEREISKQISY